MLTQFPLGTQIFSLSHARVIVVQLIFIKQMICNVLISQHEKGDLRKLKVA